MFSRSHSLVTQIYLLILGTNSLSQGNCSVFVTYQRQFFWPVEKSNPSIFQWKRTLVMLTLFIYCIQL